ncbi:MAG: PLP-dependent aminotransferase family protein [Myxococcota bacterium]
MDLQLRLPDGGAPLFLRLAEGVVAEIDRGRLRPGDALPGTRAVATQLGVHRNTVIAAWAELRSQGWIEAQPGGRTRVCAGLAPTPPARTTSARRAGFDVPAGPPAELSPEPPPGAWVLAGGRPDVRLFPADEIGRAWRRAVRDSRGKVLDYGDPRGHARMRAALAEVSNAHRGLAIGADDVVVTRGAQQALYLAAHALLRPGDRVAVERFGYPPAWAALRSAGAELVPIDVDSDGMVVDALEPLAPSLRAVYLTPHHQFPTMATLPAHRRLQLLALARRHRLAVLEDDYDNEYHFAGRPVLPLAALDRHGTVVYVGTLSKTLAPGLRLGYLVGPRPLLDAAVARRVVVDRQGELASELAIATLIEDGTYARHLRRTRKIYAARQGAMVDALTRHLGPSARFDRPMGGLALWVHGGPGVEAWAERAARAGAWIETSARFDLLEQPPVHLRAGFASLTEAEIDAAVRVLAATREG